MMSKNLYAIADRYRDLFIEIEEAEGEITPEMDAQLAITQEEIENKLYAYYSVIQASKGQDEVIKKQKVRLDRMLKANATLKERLSAKVLDACNEFGITGKSGNKVIELDTLKAYTVTKQGLEIEDEESFNHSDYVTTNIKVPYDEKIVKAVLKLVIKMANDKDAVMEANTDLKKSINKTAVTKALQLSRNVKGAKLIDKTHVVLR